MLRISIDALHDRTTIRLEGKLKGPWVEELNRAWSSICLPETRNPIQVDLRCVSFVDEHGRDLLIKMRQQGAELVAFGPMMNSVVEEIARSAAPVRPSAPQHSRALRVTKRS